MGWLAGIVGVVLTGLIGSWLMRLLNTLVPSPARVWLAVVNFEGGTPSRSDDRFRIVLCWLEDDVSGADTKYVERAFSGVDGISLGRSARIVTASGAGGDWREAMKEMAAPVLEDWNADLAVVGLVKDSGKVLSLYFVPRSGAGTHRREGTLRRADRPYRLEDVTLGEDFHDDLRAQLTAMALEAVAPLADTETRGRVLEQGLKDAAEKLAALVEGSANDQPGRRAALEVALGNALSALGQREPGTARLEQAVEAYRAALEEYTREREPLDWAMTQNNLGIALQTLGEREPGTARLEQAVEAYRAALEEYTRERVPLGWAGTQNNLGNTLQALGEREPGTARLEQAVEACRAVLEERTRERVPLDWAGTQNNLGNALQALGKREPGTARLEQAVEAYRAALEEYTRERVPLDWAGTQNNLGNALKTLGEQEPGTARLEQAVEAYRAALRVFTPDEAPHYRDLAQENLAQTLRTLREREAATKSGIDSD